MDTVIGKPSFSHIYYFILIPIGLLAYFAFAIFKTKKDKQRVTNWLNEHPDAVKVYIGKTSSVTGYLASAAQQITVSSVFKNSSRFLLPLRYNDLRCEQTRNYGRGFQIL